MSSENINYQKIIVRTLLKVLAMIIVIFILNSWPLIKQSFNGEVPAFSFWLDHSLKLSNIILIIGFGCYFYYKDLTDARDVQNKASE
ncbi:hypothetical protein [Pedobacter mucosus]|uniref:hypothetical protein n=1 Tax=Pedobacter mucosus TaxID=2895286 RepID=UPI001EE41C11|nr:hypothetical protein [Pedobacter mucosus]UKT62841.1 hypothetical protein LOK61_13830 [Pedobacter mucosus]